MTNKPDWFLGTTPLAGDMRAFAFFARFFGHHDKRHDCVARRQGRCPGLDQCHDCAWSEGMSREER